MLALKRSDHTYPILSSVLCKIPRLPPMTALSAIQRALWAEMRLAWHARSPVSYVAAHEVHINAHVICILSCRHQCFRIDVKPRHRCGTKDACSDSKHACPTSEVEYVPVLNVAELEFGCIQHSRGQVSRSAEPSHHRTTHATKAGNGNEEFRLFQHRTAPCRRGRDYYHCCRHRVYRW